MCSIILNGIAVIFVVAAPCIPDRCNLTANDIHWMVYQGFNCDSCCRLLSLIWAVRRSTNHSLNLFLIGWKCVRRRSVLDFVTKNGTQNVIKVEYLIKLNTDTHTHSKSSPHFRKWHAHRRHVLSIKIAQWMHFLVSPFPYFIHRFLHFQPLHFKSTSTAEEGLSSYKHLWSE